MEIIYKEDFIDQMAEKYGITKKSAREQYTNVFAVLEQLISDGNTVAIPGIGKFKIVEKPERTMLKPKRHKEDPDEMIVVPAHNVVKFVPSSSIKRNVY